MSAGRVAVPRSRRPTDSVRRVFSRLVAVSCTGARGVSTPIAALAALVVAGGAAGTAASDAAGWFEVGRAAPARAHDAPAARERMAVGRPGDRFWTVRAGETLEGIALETTGSARHAARIARYNGLVAGRELPAGRLLFVPAELVGPARDGAPSGAWEIREFGADGSGGARAARPAGVASGGGGSGGGGSDGGADVGGAGGGGSRTVTPRAEMSDPVAPTASVETRKVDLFVGEVDVLGVVDVTRVAVGDGAIVRAEVLDGGELLVIAQAPGSTSLRLWHRGGGQSDFNIRVAETDPETRVRMERMVRMRVRLVEFRKSALGRLGIDWSDGANGPTFAAAGDAIGNDLFRPAAEGFDGLPNAVRPFSTYFGIASNVTSRINFLASSGDAVTLAEPVLSTRSGGTASFLAGGEVPYPSIGADGQSRVQFKEYGIKLDVAPRIDEAGNVQTFVETEISQLDPAVSVQGAPGLLTRRARTEVNVRSGETIVISGLLSAESGRDVDRLPGLGRLPVLGALFRSKAHRDAVTELVIFVTPEVIEPAAATLAAREGRLRDASDARLRRARERLRILD